MYNNTKIYNMPQLSYGKSFVAYFLHNNKQTVTSSLKEVNLNRLVTVCLSSVF